MTSFARFVAVLLAVVVAACAFLPWVGASTAAQLHVKSLIATNETSLTTFGLSLAVPVMVSAGIVVVGALVNSRVLVIIGGLCAVAVPTAWILVNALTSGPASVALSQVRAGAYAAAIAGFMILILAAVAVDIRDPSAR
jgi:hypothetical protein